MAGKVNGYVNYILDQNVIHNIGGHGAPLCLWGGLSYPVVSVKTPGPLDYSAIEVPKDELEIHVLGIIAAI
ncbi:MAG: hypothetical protein ACLQC7_02490 [Thermoplasmata archaeon]